MPFEIVIVDADSKEGSFKVMQKEKFLAKNDSKVRSEITNLNLNRKI
jgi:hypothetical protein